jgi:hypothetical protein
MTPRTWVYTLTQLSWLPLLFVHMTDVVDVCGCAGRVVPDGSQARDRSQHLGHLGLGDDRDRAVDKAYERPSDCVRTGHLRGFDLLIIPLVSRSSLIARLSIPDPADPAPDPFWAHC